MGQLPIVTAEEPLSEAEQKRLDESLTDVKRAHYAAILASGFVVVMSAQPVESKFSIPITNWEVGRDSAAVFGHLLVVSLGAAADLRLRSVHRYIRLDPRRVPFSWLPLTAERPIAVTLIAWLLVPVLVSLTATMFMVGGQVQEQAALMKATAIGLPLSTLFLWRAPAYVTDYVHNLVSRRDDEGVHITLSVYLRYIMRIVRHCALTVASMLPLLATVEPWKNRAFALFTPVILVGIIPFVICLCATPFARWIDAWGASRGFAASYLSPSESKQRRKRS